MALKEEQTKEGRRRRQRQKKETYNFREEDMHRETNRQIEGQIEGQKRAVH